MFQETFGDVTIENQWRKDQTYEIVFARGTKPSKGLMTIIDTRFEQRLIVLRFSIKIDYYELSSCED